MGGGQSKHPEQPRPDGEKKQQGPAGYPTQPPPTAPMYGQSSSSTNYSPPTYPVQPPAYPTYPVQPTAHYNYAQPPPYQPVQQTIVTGDAFEAGARFNVGAERRIPPPPPGIMPNMAQYAVAQGHNVVVGQRQETILEGTGGAGAVIW